MTSFPLYARLLRAGHLDVVEENLRKILGNQNSEATTERDRVHKELISIERDIDDAFKLHHQMESSQEVVALIRDKLEKLADRKKQLIAYRDRLQETLERNNEARESRAVIEDRALAFRKGWPKATLTVQKRLLRRLVERLIYTPDGLQTYYVTARDGDSSCTIRETKMASESSSEAIPNNVFFPRRQDRRTGRFYSSGGSPSLQISGDGGS